MPGTPVPRIKGARGRTQILANMLRVHRGRVMGEREWRRTGVIGVARILRRGSCNPVFKPAYVFQPLGPRYSALRLLDDKICHYDKKCQHFSR